MLSEQLIFLFALSILKSQVVSLDGCLFYEQYRCGDICIEVDKDCHCGDKTINFSDNWHSYCCTEGPGSCTADLEKAVTGQNDKPEPNPRYRDGVCRGEVKHISSPCRGKCHLEDYEGSIPSYYNYL